MRAIKNLNDVQIVLKELLDFKNNLQTKSQDLHGNKITNAGKATDPSDYVILSQLNTAQAPQASPDQHYTIVFSSIGPVTVGQLAAPFIVGSDRVGYPSEIWVSASTAPSSAASFNIKVDGRNVLAQDIVLPANSIGPVISFQFVNPLPLLSKGSLVLPVVTVAGGAAYVSLNFQVKRKM